MKHNKSMIAAALAALLSLSACKDSSGPDSIQLTDAQAEDLMEALASVGSDGGELARRSAAFVAGPDAAFLQIPVDETEQCPGGGTVRQQGTLDVNDTFTQMTANVTNSYTGCKATSPQGVLWTFDGAPNIAFAFTVTSDATTGNYTISGTQKGAVDASSSIGSGRCAIDLTYTGSGNSETQTGSATVSGTACGRTINVTVTE